MNYFIRRKYLVILIYKESKPDVILKVCVREEGNVNLSSHKNKII